MKQFYTFPKPFYTAVTVVSIIGLAFLFSLLLPPDPAQFKYFSFIPALFLVGYIFITKRIVEGLTLASLIGIIMVSRPDIAGGGNWALNTFSNLNKYLMETMQSENTQWLIIVCGLMGSIIALIEKTGGAFAFGKALEKKVKRKEASLMWTWLLGIVIFFDDYLNSLTIGSCMTNLTDKHKVPREFLAYVTDTTAAPVCALLPISTWSIFVAKILEVNKWAPAGEGIKYFTKTIPYNFYAWIALILVPLVIFGIVPLIGPMKKAVERVNAGGPLAPPGSEKIDIHALKNKTKIPENPSVWNLLIPLFVLGAATILLDTDMQKGVLVTVAFMYVFYMVQGLITAEEFVDCCIDGFKNMLLPLLLMVLAFLFAKVNSEIHFTEYLIRTVAQVVSPKMLPITIFLTLSVTEFITGTNWGMYIIALPIVIPLGMTLGCNMPLCVAAVLSAGVFGSHICFYSDATVITSAATGCDNIQHSLTQLPYGLLGAAVSAVLFLAASLF